MKLFKLLDNYTFYISLTFITIIISVISFADHMSPLKEEIIENPLILLYGLLIILIPFVFGALFILLMEKIERTSSKNHNSLV